MVGRKTDGKRLARSLKAIADWCRKHREIPRREQHKELSRKLQGHYTYYGISLNYRSIAEFSQEVKRIWYKWLARLSAQRDLRRTQVYDYLRNYPLPAPRFVHSYC
jgi:hypothetical protein